MFDFTRLRGCVSNYTRCYPLESSCFTCHVLCFADDIIRPWSRAYNSSLIIHLGRELRMADDGLHGAPSASSLAIQILVKHLLNFACLCMHGTTLIDVSHHISSPRHRRHHWWVFELNEGLFSVLRSLSQPEFHATAIATAQNEIIHHRFVPRDPPRDCSCPFCVGHRRVHRFAKLEVVQATLRTRNWPCIRPESRKYAFLSMTPLRNQYFHCVHTWTSLELIDGGLSWIFL